MDNKYLCLFDANGYRRETYLSCEYTDEQKQEMFNKGFVEIDEEEWSYYVGNKGNGDNGTGYIRVNGKPVSAPPYVPSKAEKLATIEAQYEANKNELKGYLMDAILSGDDETVAELKEEMAELIDQTPMGRIGKGEDVAELVSFLTSDKADFITGQIITVDGGFTL
jgi:hypothetical protein